MLGLGMGLGLSSGRMQASGATWTPSELSGGVLWIDCKSPSNTVVSGRYSIIADLTGNGADITPPSESARPTIEAGTGGFVCDGSQVLQMAKAVNAVTIILAYKPVSTSTVLSVLFYAGANYLGKIQGTAGGGNGIAIQSGITQYLSTAAIVADGNKAVVSIRQRTAPDGTIRINSTPQVLVSTGNSAVVAAPTHIFTHTGNAAYSVRGVLYGMYINSTALTDTDIALAEAWMTARYL